MDLLFIVRDGLASSLISNLLAALEAKNAKKDVAVLFTGDALATLSRGSFEWPRELVLQTMRWQIADAAPKLGLAVMGGCGEGRQLDVRAVLQQAEAAGVPMLACPTWSVLLGLSQLPSGVQPLEGKTLVELLESAKRVIGSL